MKKQFFYAMLAGAAMLASCSSENVAGPETSSVANGYLAVRIELPQTPSTRAINDDFADGTSNEYAVSNASLYLFTGASESEAKFLQAVNLTGSELLDVTDTPKPDNISLTKMAVGKVNNLTVTTNLYALVIVNGSASTLSLTAGTSKLSDVLAQTSDNKFYTGTGSSAAQFLMLNAPLSNVAGGASTPASSNVSYLVRLQDNCVKETEELAKNNPAGSIYVERAVAKATLNCTATTIGSGAGSLAIKTNGVTWALDNTEPSSYILRNMGSMDYIAYASEYLTPTNHRMVGTAKMGVTSWQPEEDLYRTYWCIDPQYTKDYKDASPAVFNHAVAGDYIAADGSTPAYCHENTFDVQRQKYGNTTRAIIKVELNDNTDFFTFVGSETKYTKAAAETYFAKHILLNSDVNTALNNATYKNAGSTATAPVTESDLKLTFTRDADGVYKVTAIDFTDTWKTANVEDGNVAKLYKTAPVIGTAAVIDDVNAFVKMYQYVGGVVYYDARFMHFASTTTSQDLAPWNTASEATAGDVSHAYPAGTKSAEENYLGRYGMVRNNWYDVTVSAFNKLGSPVPTNITVTGKGDTPDDNVNEKYISVKINVLSWAKRTQSWTF